uniref:MAK10-like protein n=1 Tax=Tanacetum cinerariifolium TaxID=118510 RepID=A0A6L2M6N7_TANCI|nr:MAK10-like protein [Tanacetum cinerariifolium]
MSNPLFFDQPRPPECDVSVWTIVVNIYVPMDSMVGCCFEYVSCSSSTKIEELKFVKREELGGGVNKKGKQWHGYRGVRSYERLLIHRIRWKSWFCTAEGLRLRSRAISEDYILAREINRVCRELAAGEPLKDIWGKYTYLRLNFRRNQTTWHMGMKTQLMIEDQRVETPSGFIVTSSEALSDAEIILDLAETPLNSLIGTMWCLFDPTPSGSISTWEDLTTRFLAQFFPPKRTSKLRNDILMFQQHQAASDKLRDKSDKESWALLEDLALYDNESWSDPRDSAKPVKAISMPQDVLSTSDRRLIELENQVQRLMEAHLALNQPQAFVEYASMRIDKAGGKWYTFKPEQNNLGKTYNPSWKSHPNLRHIPGTKSYSVGIVKNVEVHVGKLKLFEDFHVVDMEREPTCPLLVGRGFLATVDAVIDCKKAIIAVREGRTRLIFGVRELDFGEDDMPYWTTIGKRESYKPRTSEDGISS